MKSNIETIWLYIGRKVPILLTCLVLVFGMTLQSISYAATLTGSIYSDEGATKITASTTVRLIINGVSAGTDTTTSGDYSITPASLSAGDKVLVYIDNDASNDGNTITVSDGNSLSGLHIYKDHVIVRQDNGGSLANSDMGSAWISDAGDILYSVDGSNNLTVSGSNTELFVWSGDTYAPGANVSTAHLKIKGSLTAGSNTLTVSGDWDMTNATFTCGTSTVDFTGTGTISLDNGWSTKPFYNINAAAAGQTSTILAGRSIGVSNLMTLGTGTLAGGSVLLLKASGTPLVTAGATLSNSAFAYDSATGPVTVAATTYPDLFFFGNSAGTVDYELAGAINCGLLEIYGVVPGGTATLDTTTSNYDITSTGLALGMDLTPIIYGSLKLNDSTLDINGDVVIYSTGVGGTNSIDADTANINVSGDWSNSDTFTKDTSTVTFDGTGTQAITSNGASGAFYNLTVTNASDIVTFADAFTAANLTATTADTQLTFTGGQTYTISDTLNLNGQAVGTEVVLRSTDTSQYIFDVTGGAQAVNYVDVQYSAASSNDITATNSVNSGNNDDGDASPHWIITPPAIISGSIYSDEGTTKITDSTTVRLVVNGVSAGTDTTTSGDYSITPSNISAGDKVLVYIDNDATNDGNTITVSDGSSLSGLHIYKDHVIVRQDNGGSLANSDMGSAWISDAGDILYSVDGSNNLTVSGSNTELFVWSGDTYAPGATIDTIHMDVVGTLTAGANAINVSGNWDVDAAATFTSTGTVTFDAVSGTNTITPGGTDADHDFENIVFNDAAGTATWELQGALDVDYDFIIYDGIVDTKSGSDYAITVAHDFEIQGGNLTANASTITVSRSLFIHNSAGRFTRGTSTVDLTGTGTVSNAYSGNRFYLLRVGAATKTTTMSANVNTDYLHIGDGTFSRSGGEMYIGNGITGQTILTTGTGNANDNFLRLNLYGANSVEGGNLGSAQFVMAANANITLLEDVTIGSMRVEGDNAVFSIGAHNVIFKNGIIIGYNAAARTCTLNLGSQTVTLGSPDQAGSINGNIFGAGTTNFNFESATLNIGAADWVMMSGVNINPGTSTAVFNRSISDQTITSAGTSFNNVEINNPNADTANDDIILADALDVNGNLTFTDGELQTGGFDITVAGNWTNSIGTAGFTGSGTVTFDTNNAHTISGSTSFSNFTVTDASNDATDVTLTFDNTATQTITGTLTLDGLDTDDRINLVSDSPDTQWSISVTGTKGTLDFLDVTDSDASGSTVVKPLAPTSSINGGNNIDWFPTTITGTVYTDEGSTNIGAGKTVRLYIDGVDSGLTSDTNASGGYTFSTVAAAGSTVLVYLEGEAEDGSTVTVSGGVDITDLHIYQDHLIVRHDNAGSMTNALLNTAEGAGAAEMLFSVDGSNNLTVTGANTELYLPTGHSYAPGAAITTINLKSLGTFTGGSAVLDINGNVAVAGGSFTNSTSGMTVENNFTHSGGTYTDLGVITFDDIDGTDDSIITCTGNLGGTVDFDKTSEGATVEIVSGCTIDLGDAPTTTITGTLTINGALEVASGTWTETERGTYVNNGTVTHNGNGWDSAGSFENGVGATTTYNGTVISLERNFTQSGTFDLTGITITFDGSDSEFDDSTITCSGTLGGTVDFDKAYIGQVVEIVNGCSVSLGAAPTTTITESLTNNGTLIIESGTWTESGRGEYINNGTITHSGDGWDSAGGLTNMSGATITYGGSALSFERNFSKDGTFDLSGKTLTLDGTSDFDDSTLTCAEAIEGNLIINKTDADGTLTLGGNCTINGNFTHTDGPIANPASAYTFSVQGNVTLETTDLTGGANFTLELGGSNSQSLTQSAGDFDGLFQVNKSGNAASLATAFTTAGASATCDIVEGTLDINGQTLTCGSTLTVQDGGNLQLIGDETLTSPVLDSGSTVTYDGTTAGLALVAGNSYHHLTFIGVGGTWEQSASLTVNGNLTVTNGTLDTNSGSNYGITVSNNFNQAATGQVEANASTITVSGNFSADGTLDSTDYNNATLIVNGAGSAISYSNLSSWWDNGFNNLTVGQGGVTNTLNNWLCVRNMLTIGSGELTGATVGLALIGNDDVLTFDPAANISLNGLLFLSFTGNQNIPPMENGYDCHISIAGGNNMSVIQTGDITLNAGKKLLVTGGENIDRALNYNTANYALTVGGDLIIGAGGDTALKTLNAGSSTITVGGDFTVRAVGGGTTQAVFNDGTSTIILNGSSTQAVTSSGSPFNNLNVTNASDVVTFSDAFTTSNFSATTANTQLTFTGGSTYTINGTLDLNGQAAGTKVQLRSTAASQYILDVTAGDQSVSFVDVAYSAANSNNIIATDSTNSGNNDDAEAAPHWIFGSPITISGTVYTDEGSTNIGIGKTVRLYIDGSDSGLSSDTNATGGYTFSAVAAAGSTVLVYVEGEAEDGSTVTVSGGVDITDLHIYQDHLIVRHDNAGSMTNALLDTAEGAGAAEMLFSVTASTLTVTAATELYVWGGDTFIPGAPIITTGMDVTGTLDAEANAINVSANWDVDAAATFTSTGTVTFDAASGTKTITPGGTDAGHDFQNIVFNDAAGTATWELQGALDVDNDFTITDGIVDTKSGSDYAITVANDLTINGGNLTANASTITIVGSVNIADVSGLFTRGTSTVELTGTGNISNPSSGNIFYHLNMAAAGETTTMTNHVRARILEFGTGTFIRSGGSLYIGDNIDDEKSLINAGVTTSGGTYWVYLRSGYGTGSIIDGGNYSTWRLLPYTGKTTLATRALSPFSLQLSYSNTTFDLNGFDLNTSLFSIGNDNDSPIFYAGSGTVTVPNLTLSNTLGTGAPTLYAESATFDIAGNVTVVTGSVINLGTASLNVGGNWIGHSGSTVDIGTTSTVTFNGMADQTITSAGKSFKNLTINNTGAADSDDIILADALDVDGTLTITDGDLDIATNDPAVNTAGNVDLGANGSIDVTGRTADWTFDGTSTLTDSSSTGPQDLEDVVINGTSLTLGSNAKLQTVNVAAGTLNMGSSGYMLEIDGTGTPADGPGTFVGGISTVKYSGSGLATNIATVPYNNLQLAPTSATTYSLTGDLSGANAMTGDLTIETNATLDAVNGTDYNLSAVNVTINGTYDTQASTITVSGGWNMTNGTFNSGTSTVDFTGTGTISNDNADWWTKYFYNVNAAAAGQTTTILAGRGIGVVHDMTLGTGTLDGGIAALLKGSGTPLVTAGATLSNDSFLYLSTPGPITVASTTYPDLWFAANSAVAVQFNLAGDINCGALSVFGNVAGGTSQLDTTASNHAITCTVLIVGDDANADRYGTLKLNNSVVDISTHAIIYSSDGSGDNSIDADSSTLSVGSNFFNQDTFIADTSTVILDGSGTQSITSGGSAFNDLTVTNSSDVVTFTDAFSAANFTATTADSQLTFTGGQTYTISDTLNLNGHATGTEVKLRSTDTSQYIFDVTGGAQAVGYVDVQYSAASSNNITATNSVNSGNNDDGDAAPHWIFGGMPTITVAKLSLAISDPINGGSNPKRIPGAVIEYIITPSNTGDGPADADSVLVTDIIDTDSVQYDVNTGINFTDGATSSGLALGTVTYSDDAAPGPYTYDYTPVPDGEGYDSNITSIKITTTGIFAFGGAPAPSFTLKYRSKVK